MHLVFRKHYGWMYQHTVLVLTKVLHQAEAEWREASDYNNIQNTTSYFHQITAKVAYSPNGTTAQTKATSVRGQGAMSLSSQHHTKYQQLQRWY